MKFYFKQFSPPFFAVFLLCIAVFTAQAQDDEVLRSETTVVRLNIGVVNKQGNSILNLNQGDFAVYEDDVKQQITRFEPTTAPFSLVMLLDVSGSTLGFRQNMVQAASRFVDALTPDDRVAVVAFNDKIELLTDFTTNRRDVLYAISLVGSTKKAGKTQFYKSLDFSLNKLKNENKRRKAIVVLTDGADSVLRDQDREFLNKLKDETQFAGAIKPEQSATLNQILNLADREGVTIYPLALPTGDPAKLPDPSPLQIQLFTTARERLQIIANRTGGSLNTINRLEDMAKLYAAVAAELRTLYSVEYEPANDNKQKNKWRTIRIEVNRPEVIAKTRPGYYAK